MRISACILFTCIVFGAHSLLADAITPKDLTTPFAVQPSAGLLVTSGVTGAFFSALASPPFSTPGIIDILSNIQAFDANGNPISNFQITGVTVIQGSSTVTPALQTFSLVSPMTYTDTLNPFNAATVDPANLNLGFDFNSDSSFQYSYFLDVQGIPDNGFILYDDIEGAAATVPEPASWSLVTSGLMLLIVTLGKRRKSQLATRQH
jgi:hypothetical protein